jgi:hypothetical protein
MEELDIDVSLEPGSLGQFDVCVGDAIVARRGSWWARLFGAGWPDPNAVVAAVRKRMAVPRG